MKRFNIFLIATVAFLTINFTLTAQERVQKFTDIQLKTLTNGIFSSNEGLQRSAIYLAGKYRIYELLPVLKDMLYTENNERTNEIILMTLGQYPGNKVDKIFSDFIRTTSNTRLKELATNYYLYFLSDALVASDK